MCALVLEEGGGQGGKGSALFCINLYAVRFGPRAGYIASPALADSRARPLRHAGGISKAARRTVPPLRFFYLELSDRDKESLEKTIGGKYEGRPLHLVNETIEHVILS